ncbi:MAG TPA: hypothetical protein VHU90_12860 [Galbitalea sp.]|jgi:hypothetical protein|nr:hypothetical protein [Galbitalea sp.]
MAFHRIAPQAQDELLILLVPPSRLVHVDHTESVVRIAGAAASVQADTGAEHEKGKG